MTLARSRARINPDVYTDVCVDGEQARGAGSPQRSRPVWTRPGEWLEPAARCSHSRRRQHTESACGLCRGWAGLQTRTWSGGCGEKCCEGQSDKGHRQGFWRTKVMVSWGRKHLQGTAGATGRLTSAGAAVLVTASLWSAAPAMSCAGLCSPGVPGLLCQTAPANRYTHFSGTCRAASGVKLWPPPLVRPCSRGPGH